MIFYRNGFHEGQNIFLSYCSLKAFQLLQNVTIAMKQMVTYGVSPAMEIKHGVNPASFKLMLPIHSIDFSSGIIDSMKLFLFRILDLF
jgi:hypothetical protein